MVEGELATAGIFSTYPKAFLSVGGGIADQVNILLVDLLDGNIYFFDYSKLLYKQKDKSVFNLRKRFISGDWNGLFVYMRVHGHRQT